MSYAWIPLFPSLFRTCSRLSVSPGRTRRRFPPGSCPARGTSRGPGTREAAPPAERWERDRLRAAGEKKKKKKGKESESLSFTAYSLVRSNQAQLIGGDTLRDSYTTQDWHSVIIAGKTWQGRTQKRCNAVYNSRLNVHHKHPFKTDISVPSA